jgi:hypothetical protein
MKKIVHSLVFLFAAFGLHSQSSYGNEWIRYDQQYFKIKLYKEGIYRVDSLTLINAGVPLDSIDARNLQVFIKGQEQYIHVEGENDGVFNSSDYLEFFGYANDCSFDSSMYIGTSFLPNPFYSVVQDTLTAFLTWNTSVSNKRFFLDTATNFSSFTPSPYFFNYVVDARKDVYFEGGFNFVGSVDPRYTVTEARTGSSCIQGNSFSVSLQTPNVFSAGPDAFIISSQVGASRDNALVSNPGHDHHLTLEWKDVNGNYNLFADTFFYGFKLIRQPLTVPSSQLASLTEIKTSSLAHPAYLNTNNTMLTYCSIFYPQTFDLNSKTSYKLFIPDGVSQAKLYADFSNFSFSVGAQVKAFDLSSGKMVYPVMTGSSGKFLLPNSGSLNKIYLTSSDNDINVTSLAAVNGTGNFVNYLAAPKDSAFLIITHSKFLSEAAQYEAYRQTLQGGAYETVLANIADLYDQFAYGIEKHPLAIKNFAGILLDSFPSDPHYLFLIGKSTYGYYGFNYNGYYQKNYVPSYGFPPADNMLTAGLNGTFLDPAIPTGRLSATTGQEVLEYLKKVEQHDTVAIGSWQKHVLHFVGGTITSEQDLFKGYLDTYKGIAQDTFFGGNVTTYIKNTSAPIQNTISSSIIDNVNNGVALMTFYGHGSNQSFDFNLNDPSVYDNKKGRYPVLLSNSCYTGDIHLIDTLSLSEKYIHAKEKGSIAFLGSVSIGVAQYLQYISEGFYRNMSVFNYGKGVGDILKGAIQSTQGVGGTGDEIEKLTCMEMTLHGDPAVRMNMFTRPDYSISNSDLFFNTNLYVDSIQVNLGVKNLGRAVNDSFIVKISRTFPDGTTADTLKKMKAPFYGDTLSFFIPVDLQKGAGLNFFSATIDFYNEIDEYDNVINNRIINIPLLINGSDIVPVYPYEFEVVKRKSPMRLKASTSNPFATIKNYVFQLDTCDKFISPIATTTITAPGGIVEWNVNLNLPDSTVYFWRVSRDSIDSLGYNWRESSFQVIDSVYGWGQAHFHQFKKDKFRFIKYDYPNRLFRFFDTKNHIHVLDGIYYFWGGILDPRDLIFNYNSSPQHIASAADNGWSFFVIDPVSGEFEMNNVTADSVHYQYGTNHQFGGTEPVPYYDFGTNNPFGTLMPEILDSMTEFLNEVPPGKYVLGYSNNFWRMGHPPLPYAQVVQSAFATVGMDTSLLRTAPDSTVIAFLGQKGMSPGTAHVEFSTNPLVNLAFEDSITAQWSRGYITSTLIGPADKWHSIHWRYTSLESNSLDTVIVHVLGVRANGIVDTLMHLGENTLDTLNLDFVIDAVTYPWLRLVAEVGDEGVFTAPQLRRWQVLFDPKPEGAINVADGYALIGNDTLQEGDYLKLRVPFKNISEFPFRDSLVWTYWIEDANHVVNPLPYKMKRSMLEPDSVILDSINVNTLGFPGPNALWIDVNPPVSSKYQYEQFHFNNILRIPFGINPDIINPILDVTFDGLHILNADIVSAKPKILITLKDENLFLALNDTADFEVYLTYPGSSVEKRIWFDPDLLFYPAGLPNNSCKIEFNPVLLDDGLYLLHVKAQDRSDNASGSTDYKIQFEVINKPSITQVMNYPNPFSTSTKFVFTLTGSEIPETFMIQVMTISGKVVREIKNEEIGDIHIGRNITEYAWDGKDEFGDILGNGVYLYRVVTRLNGNLIDRRESGADQFFTKEIGKMVIIR